MSRTFPRAIATIVALSTALGAATAQERVIGDESPRPPVRDDGARGAGHDLPEIEPERWGSRQDWELAVGVGFAVVLLIVAFLRWQKRLHETG